MISRTSLLFSLALFTGGAACSSEAEPSATPPADAAPSDDAEIDAAPPRCTPERTSADRPDDAEGAYQVRVIYAIPSDAKDEEHDVNGRIERSVKGWNEWLGKQTGGTKLRLDTCDGKLDIGFLRMSKTDAVIKAKGPYVREAIQAELPRRAKKMFAVYYGGGSTYSCGGGAWPPELVGHVGAMYLHGTPPGPIPCDAHEVGRSDGLVGYFEFGTLHELFHTMGGAATCAPNHFERGHVAGDPKDLLYRGDQPWAPALLDIGNDDYWKHSNADCLDLSKSVFLDPTPEGAMTPPGW